jgi:hypothetical protein
LYQPKKGNAVKTIQILLFAAVCNCAHAITINTDRYFAYFRVHQRTMQFTYLLSKAPCSNSAMNKRGWRAANYIVPMNPNGFDSCWVTAEDNKTKVILCQLNPIDKQDEDQIQCEPVSKSNFIDTKSLPTSPNF